MTHPLRETIARAIDPGAWEDDAEISLSKFCTDLNGTPFATEAEVLAHQHERRKAAFVNADAVLSAIEAAGMVVADPEATPRWVIRPEDVEWSYTPHRPKDGPQPPSRDVFEEGPAMAVLLLNEVVFLNAPWWMKDAPEKVRKGVWASVNCNDIFAWACSDAEDLMYHEIPDVYRAWKADPAWGTAKWCCVKRGEKPQPAAEKLMRAAGSWDDAMDALAENRYGILCRKMAAERAEKDDMLAAATAPSDDDTPAHSPTPSPAPGSTAPVHHTPGTSSGD